MTSTLLWTLIAIQIAMGAFDTLYHHELTERLPWRPSQRRELALHGVRNGLYAVLFVALGWFELDGIFAAAVLAILAAELVITLMDFVEEDLSRKLAASERVNHTLLALNYGAILILLVPILMSLAQKPTDVVGANYGWWSALATIAAFGVALFGVRDVAASLRADRIATRPAGGLATALPQHQTILVTGGTGFVGRRFVEALSAAGHLPIVLTRDPEKAAGLKPPYLIVNDLDQITSATRIDAIVHLAGESISGGLWTAARKRTIIQSRVEITERILDLVARLEHRPSVLVSASAIGWYGLRGDEPLMEESDTRDCFSHECCETCETAALKAEKYGLRVALLRIGLVLGTEGGLLARLLTPFEFGLGGRIGSGQQWMSWIARDDLVRLIAHVIATPTLDGPVNATAPEPVRNSEFTKTLGRALRRPAIIPIPAMPLQFVGGDFAKELLLGGQRVLPQRVLASGFAFRYPELGSALQSILGTAANRKPSHRIAAEERFRLT
jgi:uncharacterized protein (TIGR01777 family)